MIKVFKLKPVLMFVAVFMIAILLSVGIVNVVQNGGSVPKPIYTIVIDAGHGGLDVK